MTNRHWSAGTRIPPADYDPDEYLRALPPGRTARNDPPEDLFPLEARQRLRRHLAHEAALDRLARGAGMAIAIAVGLGVALGALVMWLMMR